MNHAHHMDHSGMDHSGMDHSGMDHSGMDHSGMDHSGHDMGLTVMNTTAKAVVDAVVSGINMAPSPVHVGHSSHMVHMMMNDTDDMGGMGMQMTFHFGYDEYVLFDWWHITNVGGLIGSMIGIFILALLYEGLKYWREHLFRKAIAAVQYCGNIHKGNITEENKATQYMEQIIMPPTWLPIILQCTVDFLDKVCLTISRRISVTREKNWCEHAECGPWDPDIVACTSDDYKLFPYADIHDV